MRRIIMLMVSLFLLTSIVFAVQQGDRGSGIGNDNPDMRDANQGSGQGQTYP